MIVYSRLHSGMLTYRPDKMTRLLYSYLVLNRLVCACQSLHSLPLSCVCPQGRQLDSGVACKTKNT